jgi:hypothetical protein
LRPDVFRPRFEDERDRSPVERRRADEPRRDELDDRRLDVERRRDADRDRVGTFAPFRRASFRPMAMACERLFTLRPDPLRSVPRFRRRIVRSTFSDAFCPYLAI